MVPTLKDVAQLAQVSVKTVSNVINGYPNISDGVRRRVEAAIEELHYRPNLSARNLRTGRTGVLALVVPGIDVPHFDELARQVVSAAAELGYRVVIEQTGLDHELTRTMAVDGVLLSEDAVPSALIEAQSAAGIPLVLLGEAHDQRCDRVAIDHARAAQDATEHLLRSGGQRIAAIGARPEESATPRSRTAGYHHALRQAGLAPPPGYLQPAGHYRRADGYRAALTLLEHPQRPDAIFCYSDPLAIGALRAVFDAGLRVPDDVAVIGIGDSEEGRYSRPTLSTVSVDTAFIAREAVARIATRIAQPDTSAVEVTAPHTVVPRESSAGLRMTPTPACTNT